MIVLLYIKYILGMVVDYIHIQLSMFGHTAPVAHNLESIRNINKTMLIDEVRSDD